VSRKRILKKIMSKAFCKKIVWEKAFKEKSEGQSRFFCSSAQYGLVYVYNTRCTQHATNTILDAGAVCAVRCTQHPAPSTQRRKGKGQGALGGGGACREGGFSFLVSLNSPCREPSENAREKKTKNDTTAAQKSVGRAPRSYDTATISAKATGEQKNDME
jgi:hypothetical protein